MPCLALLVEDCVAREQALFAIFDRFIPVIGDMFYNQAFNKRLGEPCLLWRQLSVM